MMVSHHFNMIMTRREQRAFYIGWIADYNTIASKKGVLTRSKNAAIEHLNDLKEALNGSGWLYGKRIHIGHVAEVEREIEVINEIYKSL